MIFRNDDRKGAVVERATVSVKFVNQNRALFE
jgi:hypothetical protein